LGGIARDPKRRSEMNGRICWTPLARLVLIAAAVVFVAVGTLPTFAAATGGRSVVLSVGNLSPLVALIAGILILLMPRLLNYIVAIYLIIIGLIGIGLFGRG
jgi:Protein of unknown function (DUF3096)